MSTLVFLGCAGCQGQRDRGWIERNESVLSNRDDKLSARHAVNRKRSAPWMPYSYRLGLPPFPRGCRGSAGSACPPCPRVFPATHGSTLCLHTPIELWIAHPSEAKKRCLHFEAVRPRKITAAVLFDEKNLSGRTKFLRRSFCAFPGQDIGVNDIRMINSDDWLYNGVFPKFILFIKHVAGRALSSDWFLNSFIIGPFVYEKFCTCSLDIENYDWTKNISHRQPLYNYLQTGKKSGCESRIYRTISVNKSNC